ncbi:hypothetical protein, partial [uncultured Phascolarctobacterium sp.]|uniref:hypothetical protein n=1 Tax=uncultured Phascolarctobacterium sp. TaxID=512296 RepID=UPI0027D9CD4D
KVLGWKRPGRIDSCRLEKQPVPMVQVVFLFVDMYRTGNLTAQPPHLKELCDAQACVTLTTALFHIRKEYIVPVSSNFPVPKGTTQISHGSRKKLR